MVTKGDLNKFLKSSPKYAGMAGSLVGAAMLAPVAAVPVVGGIAATYLAAAKKAKATGDESFSKEDVTRYLQEEIGRRNQSINQKLAAIEQLQREITAGQQQITECNFVLGQLVNEGGGKRIMSNSTKLVSKRRFNKSKEHMRKVHVYKDTALNAMQDASKFDTTIVESNDGYMEKLREADSTEYEILKLNMEKAETAEEREAIRKRMAEMDKERYAKDTENKTFYEKQQEAHRNHNLKILGSVAIVSGLVYKYRKPLMDMGRKLITKA